MEEPRRTDRRSQNKKEHPSKTTDSFVRIVEIKIDRQRMRERLCHSKNPFKNGQMTPATKESQNFLGETTMAR
jgi:hypothetical protein